MEMVYLITNVLVWNDLIIILRMLLRIKLILQQLLTSITIWMVNGDLEIELCLVVLVSLVVLEQLLYSLIICFQVTLTHWIGVLVVLILVLKIGQNKLITILRVTVVLFNQLDLLHLDLVQLTILQLVSFMREVQKVIY